MNRNGNETESFAGNFVASDEQGLFFEVPIMTVFTRASQQGASRRLRNWIKGSDYGSAERHFIVRGRVHALYPDILTQRRTAAA
jgi:hypothetical protein